MRMYQKSIIRISIESIVKDCDTRFFRESRTQSNKQRIIGESLVPNKKEILSLYESDVHDLVRGKSGVEVEFGNALYMTEQSDGLIVDGDFIHKQPPEDNRLVSESLERINRTGSMYDRPGSGYKLTILKLNITYKILILIFVLIRIHTTGLL